MVVEVNEAWNNPKFNTVMPIQTSSRSMCQMLDESDSADNSGDDGGDSGSDSECDTGKDGSDTGSSERCSTSKDIEENDRCMAETDKMNVNMKEQTEIKTTIMQPTR